MFEEVPMFEENHLSSMGAEYLYAKPRESSLSTNKESVGIELSNRMGR